MKKESLKSYWKSNLKYLLILCGLCYVFSLVFPILLVEQLNRFYLGGIPLGFWFATQGTMLCMVVLLFVYARLMDKLDRKYDMHEDKNEKSA